MESEFKGAFDVKGEGIGMGMGCEEGRGWEARGRVVCLDLEI